MLVCVSQWIKIRTFYRQDQGSQCRNSLSRANHGESGSPDWSGADCSPDGIYQGRFEYITDLRGLVQGGVLGSLLLLCCWGDCYCYSRVWVVLGDHVVVCVSQWIKIRTFYRQDQGNQCRNSLSRANHDRTGYPGWTRQTGHPDGIYHMVVYLLPNFLIFTILQQTLVF